MKDGVASHKRDYYFKAMEDEVKRMDLLIVDMLELAKYESGTYTMDMDSFISTPLSSGYVQNWSRHRFKAVTS